MNSCYQTETYGAMNVASSPGGGKVDSLALRARKWREHRWRHFAKGAILSKASTSETHTQGDG